MLTPGFACYVMAVLLARFVFLPEARSVGRDSLILHSVALTLAALVFFAPDGFWFGLTMVQSIVAYLVLARCERPGQEASGPRLLLLGAHLMVGVVLARHQAAVASSPVITPEFTRQLILMSGALLALKESNFFIRWFFTRLKPRPGNNELNTEQKFRAAPGSGTGQGRTIGALERLLVYVLLIAGQSMAVPVVIAVKALARFKRMEEDQTFAEYVIIGTFLSLLLALAAVGFTRWAA